jgi:uncharacterized damage-inducible protein DinB
MKAHGDSGVTFNELLRYTAQETERWRQWLATQPPEILELPAGSGRTATVRGLMHHIIVVERRYVDRLRGEPVLGYDDVPREPIEAMFAVFTDARRRLDEWLSTATEEDFNKTLEFQTLTAGTRSASARKIVAHLLIHGIRHWAQIATIMRQHGHDTGWFHDILLSDAME